MDEVLNSKVENFLSLGNPTDAEILEGARLLLRLDPLRSRGVYNSAMRRPRAMLPWIRTDLQKHLNIRRRGLTTATVEAYNLETLQKVEESLSLEPEKDTSADEEKQNEAQAPLIPVLGVRGRRADHEQLPADIQAIWERNSERWKKMRQLHAQLAQMIARPGYAPCDGNELCHVLRETDTALRADWERYDKYVLLNETSRSKDHVEVFTDNVKTIQNARTSLSRGLSRKAQNSESLKKIQDAVNTLFALRQAIKPDTMEKLKSLGIDIPNNA